MEPVELQSCLQRLLAEQRTGVLATLSNKGWPYQAMTPFAINTSSAQLIIHVSELAAHTRYLLQRPQAAFLIGASERAGEPVHALPRVSFQVQATDLDRGSDAWETARKCYLERFPDSAFMVEFKDFHLFRLDVLRARLVAGFGAAKTLPIDDVHRCLSETPTF